MTEERKTPVDQRLMLFGFGGLILLYIGYTVVFILTRNITLIGAITSALINTVPAGILAAAVVLILRGYVLDRSLWQQALAHLVLATAFAVAWYFLILVLLGARDGWLQNGFFVQPFSSVAFVWQVFQGVTLYAVAAIFAYLWSTSVQLELLTKTAEPVRDSLSSDMLVRTDGEIVSVAYEDIIRISGAGDYAEVVTRTRTIFSTTSLAIFEAEIPEAAFTRIHRSHIVRNAAIERAEPAGNGRMTLHLKNGDSVTASRAGARRMKEQSL